MDYILKPLTPELLADALRVEQAAMGDHCYLADVYEYFSGTEGELTCAFLGDEMVGIGKITILWDNSAWLETLRVDPVHKRKGIGRAIYKRYFEQLEERSTPFVSMYTNADNVASAELAKRFGLSKGGSFREYILSPSTAGDMGDFVAVDEDNAVELLTPYFEKYNNYAVMCRTYYKLNPATCRGFAREGKVWFSATTNSVLIAGARFQSEKGLHISLMEGDKSACLHCANALAIKQNAPRIVCNFAMPHIELEEFLKANNFVVFPNDFITMEKIL